MLNHRISVRITFTITFPSMSQDNFLFRGALFDNSLAQHFRCGAWFKNWYVGISADVAAALQSCCAPTGGGLVISILLQCILQAFAGPMFWGFVCVVNPIMVPNTVLSLWWGMSCRNTLSLSTDQEPWGSLRKTTSSTIRKKRGICDPCPKEFMSPLFRRLL